MRPRFTMVSVDIRRDLLAPLKYFSRLDVTHLYQHAPYRDLLFDELELNLIRFTTPYDLRRKLRTSQPDLIQGVEPFSLGLLPYLYVAFAVARRRRVPLIMVTPENRPLDIKYGTLASRCLRSLLRPVFDYAKLIIVLNEGARRNVLSVGEYECKLQRVMYATWGVDLDEFSPQTNGREPDFGSGPVLLFVGRLHPEKGIFDLLHAFREIRAQHPSAKLVLIGDGPARTELERSIHARGWAKQVEVLGTVMNDDLPRYFRAADLFVAPSITTRKWEEQIGMTNIQAMACGVPVISTRTGAIPEYVPDGVAGILVPERNPAALAAAILQLLSDEGLRAQLGRGARACAEDKYDARANVERVQALLLQVLNQAKL